MLTKYTNWDKLICLSLYIFLSFWGNERRQKPNIPHLRVSSAEEFWYKDVLELNVTFLPTGTQVNLEENSWYNWGKPNYKIIGCLALCWSLVAGFLIKGQLISEHTYISWWKKQWNIVRSTDCATNLNLEQICTVPFRERQFSNVLRKKL